MNSSLTAASLSSSATKRNTDPPDYLSEAEKKIFEKLKAELNPVTLDVRSLTIALKNIITNHHVDIYLFLLQVQDISGGCGSMYGLDIVSPRFQGLSTIMQHKLVNQVLAQEIKEWHGMQLKTKVP